MHEHVHGLTGSADPRRKILYLGLYGKIDGVTNDCFRIPLALSNELLQGAPAPRQEKDCGARGHQPIGDDLTDRTGSARDDGSSSGEGTHQVSLERSAGRFGGWRAMIAAPHSPTLVGLASVGCSRSGAKPRITGTSVPLRAPSGP